MNKYTELKNLIHAPETLVAPNAFDGISARLIEYCGFRAVQCSGYSFSISKKLKGEKLLTLEENISKTNEISCAVGIPVMADGEDGYGRDKVFSDTILKFMATGIAGINIEDQNLRDPGNSEKIISMDEMADKIRAVNSIREDSGCPDFILNARSDGLLCGSSRGEGLKIAAERCNRYLELGADLCFVPYVKTKDEIKFLKKEIQGPLSIAAGLPYNIKEFTINDCIDAGIARVSLPAMLIFTAMGSMLHALKEIKRSGTFENIQAGDRMLDVSLLDELLR